MRSQDESPDLVGFAVQSVVVPIMAIHQSLGGSPGSRSRQECCDKPAIIEFPPAGHMAARHLVT